MIVAALVILIGSAYLLYTSNLTDTPEKYSKLSELGKMFATSLQNACEARDIDSVLKVAALVDEYFAKDELPRDDRNWLVGIVKTSESGDWKKANSKIKDLLNAQQ